MIYRKYDMNFNLVLMMFENIKHLKSITVINDMFLSHSWQTRLVRIDSDAVLWSSILATLLFSIKIDSESDSKYFFLISSDHILNINRFSADVIMLKQRYVAFITIYTQNIIKLPAVAFIPPNREKMSTKSFRETIFVVPIAFSILYNMLLLCILTSIWHCFGKNKKSKYQARQSRLGGTARLGSG